MARSTVSNTTVFPCLGCVLWDAADSAFEIHTVYMSTCADYTGITQDSWISDMVATP